MTDYNFRLVCDQLSFDQSVAVISIDESGGIDASSAMIMVAHDLVRYSTKSSLLDTVRYIIKILGLG